MPRTLPRKALILLVALTALSIQMAKEQVDVAKELNQAVGRKDLDAIMDCAGAQEMMQLAFSLLSISGHYADVGLVGDRIDIPLFPRISREQTQRGEEGSAGKGNTYRGRGAR